MSSIEVFFLDLGLGYSMSKWCAYLLFPVLGFLVWLLIRRRMKKKWLRAVTLILALALPFTAYFLVHPIYEGDFSNNSVALTQKSELDKVKGPKLVVISIPNCPFCQESIGRMMAFKKRHPKVSIEYRICVNDSLAKDAVKAYKGISDGSLKIRAAEEGEHLAEVADMAFPAFVLVTKDKKLKWSNDNFGAGALDQVAAEFE